MMERVIKFRAWDLVARRMMPWKEMWQDQIWEIFPTGTPEQGPFILMQFTGLLDQGKKEIYEGDIVEFYFSADDPAHPNKEQTQMIDIVVYHEGAFYFKPHDIPQWGAFASRWNSRCKVIGNIHEHSHLLEVKA